MRTSTNRDEEEDTAEGEVSVTQLSFVTEQGFLLFAHILGYKYHGPPTPLPTLLRVLLTLLFWVGWALGWSMGHEPLTFGAVLGTVNSTETAATLRLKGDAGGTKGESSDDPTTPLASDDPVLSGHDMEGLMYSAKQCQRVVTRLRRWAENDRMRCLEASSGVRKGLAWCWVKLAWAFEAAVYAALVRLRLSLPCDHSSGCCTPQEGSAGSSSIKNEDDAEAEAEAAAARVLWRHVERMSGTLWHSSGGAPVGAVLAPADLRVRGTTNVHVCGAAAFPFPPRVNPMASCYAMGWRLGELLTLNDPLEGIADSVPGEGGRI